jgi:hypothetical protein
VVRHQDRRWRGHRRHRGRHLRVDQTSAPRTTSNGRCRMRDWRTPATARQTITDDVRSSAAGQILHLPPCRIIAEAASPPRTQSFLGELRDVSCSPGPGNSTRPSRQGARQNFAAFGRWRAKPENRGVLG